MFLEVSLPTAQAFREWDTNHRAPGTAPAAPRSDGRKRPEPAPRLPRQRSHNTVTREVDPGPPEAVPR